MTAQGSKGSVANNQVWSRFAKLKQKAFCRNEEKETNVIIKAEHFNSGSFIKSPWLCRLVLGTFLWQTLAPTVYALKVDDLPSQPENLKALPSYRVNVHPLEHQELSTLSIDMGLGGKSWVQDYAYTGNGSQGLQLVWPSVQEVSLPDGSLDSSIAGAPPTSSTKLSPSLSNRVNIFCDWEGNIYLEGLGISSSLEKPFSLAIETDKSIFVSGALDIDHLSLKASHIGFEAGAKLSLHLLETQASMIDNKAILNFAAEGHWKLYDSYLSQKGSLKGSSFAIEGGKILNEGRIKAEEFLQLYPQALINSSSQARELAEKTFTATAAVSAKSPLIRGKKIHLSTTESSENNGTIMAQEELRWVASQDMIQNGTIRSEDALRLQCGKTFANTGSLEAVGDLYLKAAEHLYNYQSGEIATGGSLKAIADQRIWNKGALLSKGGVSLESAEFMNKKGGALISEEAGISFTGSQFTNKSRLQALAKLAINTGQFYNAGSMCGLGGMDLTLKDGHNLGVMESLNPISVALEASFSNHRDGKVLSSYGLAIHPYSTLDRADFENNNNFSVIQNRGIFWSSEDILMGASKIINHGEIKASRSFALLSGIGIPSSTTIASPPFPFVKEFSLSGSLEVGGKASITAGRYQQEGFISARDIRLKVGSLDISPLGAFLLKNNPISAGRDIGEETRGDTQSRNDISPTAEPHTFSIKILKGHGFTASDRDPFYQDKLQGLISSQGPLCLKIKSHRPFIQALDPGSIVEDYARKSSDITGFGIIKAPGFISYSALPLHYWIDKKLESLHNLGVMQGLTACSLSSNRSKQDKIGFKLASFSNKGFLRNLTSPLAVSGNFCNEGNLETLSALASSTGRLTNKGRIIQGSTNSPVSWSLLAAFPDINNAQGALIQVYSQDEKDLCWNSFSNKGFLNACFSSSSQEESQAITCQVEDWQNEGIFNTSASSLSLIPVGGTLINRGGLTQTGRLVFADGSLSNEGGHIKAKGLWIYDLKGNTGIIESTGLGALSRQNQAIFNPNGVPVGLEDDYYGAFIGIQDFLVNKGKIVCPEGVAFFGHHIYQSSLEKRMSKLEREFRRIPEQHFEENKSPFMPATYGFWPNAVFENSGEINAGDKPLVIKNVRKFIHRGIENEPGQGYNWLRPGFLQAGSVDVQCALFGESKLDTTSTLLQEERVLGSIYWQGIVNLTGINPTLVMLAESVVQETDLTAEGIYHVLPAVAKLPGRFTNTGTMQAKIATLNGLDNQGSIIIERDFGDCSGFLKALSGKFKQVSPLLYHNSGEFVVKGSLMTQNRIPENFMTNIGILDINNPNNLHVDNQGKIFLGDEAATKGQSCVITLMNHSGDVFGYQNVDRISIDLIGVDRLAGTFYAPEDLSYTVRDGSRPSCDLEVTGTVLAKGRLNLLWAAGSKRKLVLKGMPNNLSSSIDTPLLPFPSLEAKGGDLIAGKDITINLGSGLKLAGGRILCQGHVVIDDNVLDGNYYAQKIINNSFIQGLRSICLRASHLGGMGHAITQGEFAAFGNTINIGIMGIESWDLTALARQELILPDQGIRKQGSLKLAAPHLILQAPFEANHLLSVHADNLEILGNLKAGSSLHLEADQHLAQSPDSCLDSPITTVAGNGTAYLAGGINTHHLSLKSKGEKRLSAQARVSPLQKLDTNGDVMVVEAPLEAGQANIQSSLNLKSTLKTGTIILDNLVTEIDESGFLNTQRHIFGDHQDTFWLAGQFITNTSDFILNLKKSLVLTGDLIKTEGAFEAIDIKAKDIDIKSSLEALYFIYLKAQESLVAQNASLNGQDIMMEGQDGTIQESEIEAGSDLTMSFRNLSLMHAALEARDLYCMTQQTLEIEKSILVAKDYLTLTGFPTPSTAKKRIDKSRVNPESSLRSKHKKTRHKRKASDPVENHESLGAPPRKKQKRDRNNVVVKLQETHLTGGKGVNVDGGEKIEVNNSTLISSGFIQAEAAHGKLELNKTTVNSQDFKAVARSIAVKRSHVDGGKEADLTARQRIKVSHSVIGGGDADLDASSHMAHSTLSGTKGVDIRARKLKGKRNTFRSGQGSIQVDTQTTSLSQTDAAAGDSISLHGSQQMSLEGGSISVGNDASISSGGCTKVDMNIEGNSVTINGKDTVVKGSHRAGVASYRGEDRLSLTRLNTTAQSLDARSRSMDIQNCQFDINGSAYCDAQNDLTIGNSVLDAGTLRLATSLMSVNHSTLSGTNGVDITAKKLKGKSNTFRSSHGSIHADTRTTSLKQTTATAGNSISFSTSSKMNMEGGSISAGNDVSISSGGCTKVDMNIEGSSLAISGNNTTIKGNHRAETIFYEAQNKLTLGNRLDAQGSCLSLKGRTVSHHGFLKAQSLSVKSRFLKQTGAMDADSMSIDTQKGVFTPSCLYATYLSLSLKSHKGSARGALQEVDGFYHVTNVALSMAHLDFLNHQDISLNHRSLSATFKSIRNTKEIHSNGYLSLEGITEFFNGKNAKIRAKNGLSMKTNGTHSNYGILSGEEGDNVIEAKDIKSDQASYQGKNVIQRAKRAIKHKDVFINSTDDTMLQTKSGGITLKSTTEGKKSPPEQPYGPRSAKQQLTADNEMDSPIPGKSTIKAGGNLAINRDFCTKANKLKAEIKGSASLSAKGFIFLNSQMKVSRPSKSEPCGALNFKHEKESAEDVETNRTEIMTGGDLSIISQEGSLEAKGASFLSGGNQTLTAKKDINLGAVTAAVKSRHEGSSWWGLNQSSMDKTMTKSLAFQSSAGGTTTLRSSEGKVMGDGATLIADKLMVHGEKGIKFNAIPLEQLVKTKKEGLTLNVFGIDIINPENENAVPTLKGIHTKVEVGYQARETNEKTTKSEHGHLKANHISVSTGKGASTDLRGANVTGKNEGTKVQEFHMDTDELRLGGTENTTATTTNRAAVKVGVDVVTQTPTVGVSASHDHNENGTFDKTRFQVVSLVNHREGAKIGISQGIDAHIDSSNGKGTQLHVDHAQSCQSQSGWSAGVEVGAKSFGIDAGFKTGEKRSSEGLTTIYIGTNSNIERTDAHHKDSDTRFGLSGGFSVGKDKYGETTKSFNFSTQVGDYSMSGGYSTKTTSSGKVTQNFQFGGGYKDVHLNADTAMFRKTDAKNWMGKSCQYADKGLYATQQGLNVVKAGYRIAGSEAPEFVNKIEHGVGFARQGAAAGAKAADTKLGSKLANKVTLAVSSHKCAKEGLEHILPEGKSYEQAISDADVNVSKEGLKLSKMEKILKSQEENGGIQNYHMEEVQDAAQAQLSVKLNQLGTDKASLIVKDPDSKKDHMVSLQRGEDGQWKVSDKNGPVDLGHNINGIMLATNTKSEKSYVNYNRNNDVYVGSEKNWDERSFANTSVPTDAQNEIIARTEQLLWDELPFANIPVPTDAQNEIIARHEQLLNEGYVFIGWHGTSEDSANKLLRGDEIQPSSFLGDNKVWNGFYVASNTVVAARYARKSDTGTGHKEVPGKLLRVYVKRDAVKNVHYDKKDINNLKDSISNQGHSSHIVSGPESINYTETVIGNNIIEDRNNIRVISSTHEVKIDEDNWKPIFINNDLESSVTQPLESKEDMGKKMQGGGKFFTGFY